MRTLNDVQQIELAINILIAYTLESNGQEERAHRITLDDVYSCHKQPGLLKKFWSYAVRHFMD